MCDFRNDMLTILNDFALNVAEGFRQELYVLLELIMIYNNSVNRIVIIPTNGRHKSRGSFIILWFAVPLLLRIDRSKLTHGSSNLDRFIN